MEMNSETKEKLERLMTMFEVIGNDPRTVDQLTRMHIDFDEELISLAISLGYLEEAGTTPEPFSIPTYKLSANGLNFADEIIKKRNNKI